jgi:hypothetical protein
MVTPARVMPEGSGIKGFEREPVARHTHNLQRALRHQLSGLLLADFSRCFPDVIRGVFKMLERLADFIVVIHIGPGPFKPLADILQGIGGEL